MRPTLSRDELGVLLERVYVDCHRRELIDPDPVLVVLRYGSVADREMAGLFCASLALGRARSIADACTRALLPFGENLSAAVRALGSTGTRGTLGLDRYRFFSGTDMASLLSGIGMIQERCGSLEAAFLATGGSHPGDCYPGGSYPGGTYSGAGPSASLLGHAEAFVRVLLAACREAAAALGSKVPLAANLISSPRDGSACKRLMLFFRWMVRCDEIDMGCWPGVYPSELVMPLDTHVHRIALELGLTRRPVADLQAALEVTEALRYFDPADPVRFDFSLARLGIRSDYSLNTYIAP